MQLESQILVTKKIKDLPIQIIDGDRSAKYPRREEFMSSGVLFLNTTNIEQGRLNLLSANYVTEEKFEQIKKGRLQRGDLVMTTRGSIGKIAQFNSSHAKGLINAQMLILRADERVIHQKFLFYFLIWEHTQQVLKNFSSGAAQPQIPIRDLKDVEMTFPRFQTQQKIAAILSAYDDLIENNTQRIQILEEMARRVYEEWFVRFRFPGNEKVKMVESELGLIPDGWEVKKLGLLIRRLAAGNTYSGSDVTPEGDVIVVDQSTSEYLGFHNNQPDHHADPENPIIIFGDHTCKLQVVITPFSLGANTVPFVGNDETSVYYLYNLIRGLVTTQEYKRHWTELNNKKVIKASSKLCVQYVALVKPFFVAMDALRSKNRKLRCTRDLLLPKLISGEIDVSNFPEPVTD